jgi:hypothetical protein
MTAKTLVAVTNVTVVAVMAGCATANRIEYTPVNPAPRSLKRRPLESVGVFVGAPPDRPHVDVGVFEVYQGDTASGAGRSTSEMLETVKKNSALLGCDAIHVFGIDVVGHRHGNSTRVVRAVCEVYTDDEARRAAETRPALPALPGEGGGCNTGGGVALCPEPLVCDNQVCVTPYR